MFPFINSSTKQADNPLSPKQEIAHRKINQLVESLKQNIPPMYQMILTNYLPLLLTSLDDQTIDTLCHHAQELIQEIQTAGGESHGEATEAEPNP